MGEAAVGFLVESIGSLLEKEVALLGGVRGEIRELKLELESTRSFLRDVDKYKDEIDEGVRLWVAQVRDLAYKVEDIIDEFMYHMDRLRRRRGGLKALVHGVVNLPRVIIVKHKTAIKLKEVKAEIQAIAERSKRYNLGSIEEGPSSHNTPILIRNLGDSSFFIKDNEVVGIEKEKKLLLNWLMDEEMQRTVISVVGMGGSGKTTLAANAYHNHIVKRVFDCSAWVSLSKNSVIDDLLRRMIKDFFDKKKELVPTDLSTMDYKQLVETLVQFLREKRYVVVFDNVWTTNFWMQISVALPDNRRGSRVILTTRMEDIASYPYGVASHVLHPQPLRWIDAWSLFCKKAFSTEPNQCCPPELEKIAGALLEKCEGLPIAIVAMGGLMASKDKSELKWQAVYDSLNWHLSNNPMLEMVKTILLLSFDDLPYNLKYCFLYCCIFPEDHWVGADRLVRLWMAEGFVENRAGVRPEDVGKSYLKELASRSLLQIIKSKSFLRSKLCKLHDLMRELAISVSKRENFCSIYHLQGEEEEVRARRLSIHSVGKPFPFCSNSSQVRSFYAFNFDKSNLFSFDTLLSGFRLLRVLDLKDAPIDNLPNVLGRLFNLRYLNLKGTRINELPKSIGKLRNLQTLDIRSTGVKALPNEIDKLQNLRHLFAYHCRSAHDDEQFEYITGMQVPYDVWKLKNLQVLNFIEANNHDMIREIGKMTQIKRIGLTQVREADELALCSSIEKLKLLKHLLVMVNKEEETLRMDALSSPFPVLRRLTMVGRLNNVPPWFPSLHNIKHLHLHWSQLKEDPIPCICKLTSLESLVLVNAVDHGMKQLSYNEGFHKLKYLSLVVFPQLSEMIISKGVMPSLKRLKLHVCAKLKKVPKGIEHLINLEELDLKDVSGEFIESIRGEESIDCPSVKHIPVINHSYQTEMGYKYESLSSYFKENTVSEHDRTVHTVVIIIIIIAIHGLCDWSSMQIAYGSPA